MPFMEVQFPGGKRVDASFREFTVRTDQPVRGGGEGSAPTPYELFLASLATCAGIFALGFCQGKNIDTEGLTLAMDLETDPETRQVRKVIFSLGLPPGFPEKYHDAILRSIDLCAVKKTLQNPPEFETILV